MRNSGSIYITSECVSGPVVEGINCGPCVNQEYFNFDDIYDYNYEQRDRMRFDVEYDIEETKHEYTDEELKTIYDKNYSQLSNYDSDNENDKNSVWRNLNFEMEKEYWLMREKDMEEQKIFEEEENRYQMELERCIGIKNR